MNTRSVLRCLMVVTVAHIAIPLHAEIKLPTRQIASLPADPAADMVAGMDRFLLQKIEEANQERQQYWMDASMLERNRKFLIDRLGLESKRHPKRDGMLFESPAIGQGESFTISRVRWPVLSHPAAHLAACATLWAEGLHLGRQKPGPLVILIPDADELPEDYLPGDEPTPRQMFVARLATEMEVLILHTSSRKIIQHGGAQLTRREYLHRSAFELGRTLTGYEVQMVQAVIDRWDTAKQVIVCGIGEGGATALMTGAIDARVDLTMVGSYFERRDSIWSQPISRQIFGLLERFSDAHLAALIAPRGFVGFTDQTYTVELPGGGGAPATWTSPTRNEMVAELERFTALSQKLHPEYRSPWSIGDSLQATAPAIEAVIGQPIPKLKSNPVIRWQLEPSSLLAYSAERADRLLATCDAHNQALLAESEYERGQFMNLGHSRTIANNDANQLDTSSPAAYEASVQRFRKHFREQTIGWFKDPLLPPDARSVETRRGKNWTSYGVILDVFPDVFAYGELLIPDGIEAGEKRPVVVCQHGLEGRPEDTIVGDHRAYHDFSAKLAEEGFIVFAPQNPYIGKDAFRTLQRKSYPIGKTLFSLIGAQHQQILHWLQSLPQVDSKRIAFYGLSYGGKSAMRLPALLPEYCLSICSADFNDWVWKNASSRSRYSYVGTGEYEIFEFGLGKWYNYAEMAALIAPRPFMVERGHYDGVAPDDRVAKEFAKVRHLYQARLKLPEHSEIEWFDGPHTIHGQGTFAFLRKHLDWPPQPQ